ncbi:RHS repeat protein, partial [bacterium]|nr:RHS repeat protein [bacterium]
MAYFRVPDSGIGPGVSRTAAEWANTRHTYTRSYNGFDEETDPDFEEVEFEGGNDASQIYLSVSMPVKAYGDLVVENSDEETLCENVPGEWKIKRSIKFDSTETEALNEIKAFELRLLTVKNFRVEKVQVDPNSEDHNAKFRGDLYALPVGWVPDDSQIWNYTGWSLIVFDGAESNVLETFDGLEPDELGDGKIAEIVFDWDGRFNRQGVPGPNNDPVEGVYTAQVLAGTRTDQVAAPVYITVTQSRPQEIRVKICGCRCKECEKAAAGNMFLVFDLTSGMLQSFVGPPLHCAVSYCSLKHDQEPQSMGFGWSGPSTARVLEPEDQDGALVYRSEGGVNLRWEVVDDVYVPTTSNNKIKVVKTWDPNATYVLTFPDQSQREFNEDGLLMRTVDRNGLALTYQYTDGLLTSMTDASDQVLSFDYGSREDGQPVSISSLSRVTTMDYDEAGRLEVITDPAGQTTTFVYNEDGRLWKIKDTRDEVAMTYLYDAEGRIISEQTYDQSLVSTYYDGSSGFQETLDTYDFHPDPVAAGVYAALRVVTVTEDLTQASPAQVSMSFFNANGRVICREDRVSDVVSNRMVMEFEDPNDSTLMTRMINPNLAQTVWTYDADGNVKTVTDNDGNVTEYFYAQELDDPLNPLHKNLLRLVVRPGSSFANPSLEIVYDENGNLQRVYDEKRNYTDYDVSSLGLVESITDRRGHTTSMSYDPTTHRLLTITGPADSNDAFAERTVTLGYDDYGNVNSVSDDLDQEILYEFDGVDRVTQMTDARGKTIEMNYVNGLLDNVVAPPNAESGANTRTTRFSYDDSGRLTLTESEVDESDFQSRVGYSYTGFSQLKQLRRWKDATEKHCDYVYDSLGRMISALDFGGRETVIEHAPFCVENTVTTPRGIKRKSSFNSLCQLTRLRNTDETKRFWYDQRGRVIKVAAGANYATEGGEVPAGFASGQYVSSHYAFTTKYTYNELDLVTRVDYGTGFSILYDYDEEENLIRVTDTNGRVTEYSYYNNGRLYQVTHQSEVFTYQYDEVGRLLSITYPSSTGLVASFTKTDDSSGWNENGQLLCLRYLKGGNHFQRFEYSYDDSGNRIQLIDTPENLANQVTWDYNYDWLNRLAEVKRDSTTTSVYAYDESDNRIELQLPQDDKVWTYGYDIADRIQSRSLNISGGGAVEYETFEHDDDGNMISRTLSSNSTVTQYFWDADNRLGVTLVGGNFAAEASYEFDGIRRSGYQAGEGYSSRYFSSGGMSLSEQARDGTSLSFIQGHQILGLNDGTDLFYHISDGLGSVRLIVDEDGDAVASFSTDEFGVEEVSSGTRTDLNFMTYVGSLGVRKD